MNNKQKIIVSVTGIFLVLLLLVGLTYGYFLTKISGNTNSKSISVSTANLQLVYGDGNGDVTATNIIPGNVLTTKTFTVKNEGNDTTNYIVVIDNATSTFTNNDFVYTLTCTSDGEPCTGVDTETTFPITGGTLVSNTIEVGKTHTYSLTVTYKDTGVDQSEDMGKTFTARVNIADPNSFNPYAGDKTTLAYNIINNAVNVTNEQKTLGYAEYRETPLTTPAAEISGENESTLSTTQDDYGTSYYYRGGVEDNYVNFAGMCWRIVRIEGDGSTKLILEDKNTTCESSTYTGNWSIGNGNYGYDNTSVSTLYKMNYLNPVTNNTSSMVKAFYDFQKSKLVTDTIDYTDKLKSGDWCLGDTAYTRTGSSSSDYTYTLLTDTSSNYSSGTSFYYDAYTRLTGENKDGYNPTLKCNGTKLDKFATVENVSSEAPMYVSTLTADEVVYAGGKNGDYNRSYYLINEEYSKGHDGVFNDYYFSTLTPYYFNGWEDVTFLVGSGGIIHGNYYVGSSYLLRPVVSLASSAKISSGDGSISNPYTIK